MENHNKTAFPDFDYDIVPLIAELPGAWSDNSWKNDAMPCAVPRIYSILQLWFDYSDPSKSEFPEGREAGTMKKYSLSDSEGMIWFDTNEWAEMRGFIKANDKAITNYLIETAARDVAQRFTAILRECITVPQWNDMVRKNRTLATYASGACASHDYCDANMPMAEAFKAVTNREPDGNDEIDAAIWNKAWATARELWNEEAAQ